MGRDTTECVREHRCIAQWYAPLGRLSAYRFEMHFHARLAIHSPFPPRRQRPIHPSGRGAARRRQLTRAAPNQAGPLTFLFARRRPPRSMHVRSRRRGRLRIQRRWQRLIRLDHFLTLARQCVRVCARRNLRCLRSLMAATPLSMHERVLTPPSRS